jgi:hypothetical protein
MVRWFRDRPEFTDTAFVAIGDYDHLKGLLTERGLLYGTGLLSEGALQALLSERGLPGGMRSMPSAYPRLFLGLTRGGSLAGLFGHVVLT